MTAKTAGLDERIAQYILEHTLRDQPLLHDLREETAQRANAQMQIGPEQGQFMALIARAIEARRYLEIGVFTGYSALVMALALLPDGQVVACDVSEEYTSVARRYWKRAGVDGRIDLRLGPALQTLDRLAAERAEPFDIAFIDADKTNVDGYYERALELLRPGGIVMIDNVLWSCAVIDADAQDPETRALRAIAEKVGRDERVDCSLLPLCDGLLLARKR